MQWKVEPVDDVRAAWPELEPLALGIIRYHEQFRLQKLRDDWSTRLMEYMAKPGEAVTLVVRDAEGKPAGFLNGSIRREGIFDEVSSFVDNAYVADGARHGGAGSQLLSQFEAWAKEHGAEEVKLDVVAANQLGYEFWSSRGFRVEMHVMRKELGR